MFGIWNRAEEAGGESADSEVSGVIAPPKHAGYEQQPHA